LVEPDGIAEHVGGGPELQQTIARQHATADSIVISAIPVGAVVVVPRRRQEVGPELSRGRLGLNPGLLQAGPRAPGRFPLLGVAPAGPAGGGVL